MVVVALVVVVVVVDEVAGALGLVKQLFRSTTRPVVLFNTSFGLSHNGEGGRLASAEPAALEQAFLIHTTRQADDARS